MRLNIKEDGFEVFFRDYQIAALRHLWSLKEGQGGTTKEIYLAVNSGGLIKRRISRASIINFLQAMAKEGLLGCWTATGKGGERGVYYALFDEEETKKVLAERVILKLLKMWPKATKAALESIKEKHSVSL